MKITVIGAGSWGTALALHLRTTTMRSPFGHAIPTKSAPCKQIAKTNAACPAPSPSPDRLCRFAEALKDSQLALIVTSVAGLRSSAELLKQHNAADIPCSAACKGFETRYRPPDFPSTERSPANNKKKSAFSQAQALPKNWPPNCLRRRSPPRKQRMGGKKPPPN